VVVAQVCRRKAERKNIEWNNDEGEKCSKRRKEMCRRKKYSRENIETFK